MESLVSIGIILSYVMVAFAALTAVGFGVKKMMQNTNNAKKTIYLLGGLLLTSFTAYILASGTLLTSYEKYDITSLTSKLAGMGMYSYYILAFIASLLILAYAIKRNWKQTILIMALMIIIISFVFYFWNIAIILTYFMIAFAALIVIGFKIKLMNKKEIKKLLINIGGFLAILIISYLTSDGETLNADKDHSILVFKNIERMVGMGLKTFYVLIIGAIGAVLYAEISKKILNNG